MVVRLFAGENNLVSGGRRFPRRSVSACCTFGINFVPSRGGHPVDRPEVHGVGARPDATLPGAAERVFDGITHGRVSRYCVCKRCRSGRREQAIRAMGPVRLMKSRSDDVSHIGLFAVWPILATAPVSLLLLSTFGPAADALDPAHGPDAVAAFGSHPEHRVDPLAPCFTA
ncbi:hypothetical protein [Streptomyces sp. NPDC090036]|uniref:hypothetical protein n=1 Tax=Streptomyces sp. NPDC090036 TaxID=3365926 RepID=UPI0038196A3A